MIHINIWIALTETAKNILRPLLDDEDYAGQHLQAVIFFREMREYAQVERMFKTPTFNSSVWHLFSLTFNDLSGQASQKVQDGLVHMEANYPNQFEVVGVWKWDGLQAGTQWELDIDGRRTGNVIGTPTYPIHPQTLQFMPDVWDGVPYDPLTETPNYIPATVLTDVNLIQGQTERRFT